MLFHAYTLYKSDALHEYSINYDVDLSSPPSVNYLREIFLFDGNIECSPAIFRAMYSRFVPLLTIMMLLKPCHFIDVTFCDDRLSDNIMTCPALFPGQRYLNPFNARQQVQIQGVRFSYLVVNQIATVGAVHPIAGCSEVIDDSKPGARTWAWRIQLVEDHGNTGFTDWYRNMIIQAASARYIEMHMRLLPEMGTRSHLAVEGLLGLVWVGGHWFVSEAAQPLLRGGSGGGSSVVPRSRLKDIWFADKGMVYATSPRKAINPSFVTVNGITYRDSEKEDLADKVRAVLSWIFGIHSAEVLDG